MDFSAPLVSPSSDEQFWSNLRDRVDSILNDRRSKQHIESSACRVESEHGKRSREDSQLLIQGLDSVASSLSQLSNNLSAARQGVTNLAKPYLKEILQSQIVEDEQPKAKRHCVSNELLDKNVVTECDNSGAADSVDIPNKSEPLSCHESPENKEKHCYSNGIKSVNLRKAKSLAISMSNKAASLARELKTMKSELCFTQERCNLLEEENRRLREGFEKGARPEEDDLVRLQLEALLAEKSRLANENANLMRENQCLHQLVEYHQLTSQGLLASYEEATHGTCLDFSSPSGMSESELDDNNDYDDIKAPCTPATDKFGLFSALDEHSENQKQ